MHLLCFALASPSTQLKVRTLDTYLGIPFAKLFTKSSGSSPFLTPSLPTLNLDTRTSRYITGSSSVSFCESLNSLISWFLFAFASYSYFN